MLVLCYLVVVYCVFWLFQAYFEFISFCHFCLYNLFTVDSYRFSKWLINDFFIFWINMENHQQKQFQFVRPPGRELLPHPGCGWGGNRDQSLFHPSNHIWFLLVSKWFINDFVDLFCWRNHWNHKQKMFVFNLFGPRAGSFCYTGDLDLGGEKGQIQWFVLIFTWFINDIFDFLYKNHGK